MKTNMKVLLAAAGLSEIFSGFSASSIKSEATEDKSKWQMTVDFVMIVGKYFQSSKDFVNVMKVCKRYEELALMYKFNPISDISLFENIQTQHFYKEEDIKNKKEGLFRYIYWFSKNYEDFKNKGNNEIFKNMVLNAYSKKGQYPLAIENGNCIVPEGIVQIGYLCFV